MYCTHTHADAHRHANMHQYTPMYSHTPKPIHTHTHSPHTLTPTHPHLYPPTQTDTQTHVSHYDLDEARQKLWVLQEKVEVSKDEGGVPAQALERHAHSTVTIRVPSGCTQPRETHYNTRSYVRMYVNKA